MPLSLHNEAIRGYYRTTSGRSHASSREHYERAAEGLLRRLRPWLPRDREARCLDLGCGCGEMLYLLEREGFRHTGGVNLCQEELEQARSYVRGDLIHSDALEYLQQTQAASVEFVTALNFLEHFSKDMLLSLLRQIRRILRPGGTLVAMVPNAISPFGGLTRHWDITHEWAFVPNNFRQLAALSGFDADVEFRECGPTPHGFLSAVRYLIWRMIRGGIALYFFVEVGDSKDGIYTMDMLVRLQVPRG